MIRVRRVYALPEPGEGARFLVDRLWPRGIAKASLGLQAWARDVAPSDALRRRFGHDPARWDDFRRDYFAELDAHPEVCKPLLDAARGGGVTLLFAARDERHNDAVALREYLERRLRAG